MKKITFILLALLIGAKVNALSISSELKENGTYINSEGVEITKEFYNEVNDKLTDDEINLIDKRLYQTLSNSKIKTINIKFIETTSIKIADTKFIIKERTIDASSYNNLKSSTVVVDDGHITDYKTITLIVSDKGTYYTFYIQNSWKKEPTTKSYDVIALRWSGTVNEDTDNTEAIQDYKKTIYESGGTITYSPTSGNYKYFSNGVGLSQNLVDDYAIFTNTLSIPATCSGSVTVYGTYQHAQSAVTLAQSQSYTLSNSGLGNVLYYSNSTIRNKYDNTSGLSVNFTC